MATADKPEILQSETSRDYVESELHFLLDSNQREKQLNVKSKKEAKLKALEEEKPPEKVVQEEKRSPRELAAILKIQSTYRMLLQRGIFRLHRGAVVYLQRTRRDSLNDKKE